MIEHISIRDFQSWRKLDLELGPVTMLVGKGNSGKTAIVRALKYALTNQTGDDFIREGASKTVVGLSFDHDDEAFLWTKARGKGGTYQLSRYDGEFTKTGSSVPREIADAVGMNEIAIDKTTTLMPNIQMQFDAPFIIGESGSKIARILGRLTKLNILVTAQMACRADAESARRNAAATQAILEDTERRLARFPALNGLQEQLLDLTAKSLTLNAQGLALSQARRLLTQRARAVAVGDAGSGANRLMAQAQKLADKVDNLYLAQDLVRRRGLAVANLADAGIGVDRTREVLDDYEMMYHDACSQAGVCKTCPWISS